MTIQKEVEPPNAGPQSGEFITELYIILIGIAFGFAAQTLFTNFSITVLANFLTLSVSLLIWLQTQIAYSSFPIAEENKQWRSRITAHYLATASALLLVFGSLALHKSTTFALLFVFSFVLSGSKSVYTIIKVRQKKNSENILTRVSKSYIVLDFLAAFALGSILLIQESLNPRFVGLTSIIFFLVRLIIAMTDYSINRDFYFGNEKPIRKTRTKRNRQPLISKLLKTKTRWSKPHSKNEDEEK